MTDTTFTFDEIMQLSVAERQAMAPEFEAQGHLTPEQMEQVTAAPVDPDLMPVEDPDTPPVIEEPAAPDPAPAPELAPLTNVQPVVEPPAPVALPDLDAITASVTDAETRYNDLLQRYDDLDVTPEEFREQSQALVREIAEAKASQIAAQRTVEEHQQTQEQSDAAWFAAVETTMQANAIDPNSPRAMAFDAVVRRYEETRPDLADGDKLQAAVTALKVIEAAGITSQTQFTGFHQVLANIEASRADLDETGKVHAAIKAYAAVAEAAGMPLTGKLPVAPTGAQDPRLERPTPTPTLGTLPTAGLAGVSDGGRTADVLALINNGNLTAHEQEALMAQIPEDVWDRETRKMRGNDYAGY